MQNILLFGAGKSATVLIDYLKKIVAEKNWLFTIADANIEIVSSKAGNHPNTKAVALDILNDAERQKLIQKASLVISMMPPHLHEVVAKDCASFGKHLLTASYVGEGVKKFEETIKEKGLLFLCEMGLDPGIDHMSAMEMIDEIKAEGGTITSFKSHCGGLVAPESDDNPWHYKISWNPRNVVLAGKAGAVYKMNNNIINAKYEELFNPNNIVSINNEEQYAYYPNRDSLNYISLYGLENTATFLRTTLRHPDYCFGWKNVIDLKLTDEEKVYDTYGMSIADFFHQHLKQHGFEEWLMKIISTRLSKTKELLESLMKLMEAEEENPEEADEEIMLVNEKGNLENVSVDDIKTGAAETVANQMHEANISMKQLFFLGMDDDETMINKGLCSAADIMQFILEKKLAMQPTDKDMIVMLHEFEYEMNGIKKQRRSLLKVMGKDALHTAMAKTVGLPLGIAAKLILEGKIKETGVQIPVKPSIYKLVLEELKFNGIKFEEL